MSDAGHTPSEDGSFRASLLRKAGGAAGLVVAVAALFWGIGALGGGDGTPVVEDVDEDPDVAAPSDDGADTTDGADGGGGDTDAAATDADAGPQTDDADGSGADGSDADDADAGDADAADGEDAGAGDGDDAGEVERTVEPGEVDLQVLDGFKEDGGAAADAAAELLGDAGYNVVARNDALTYEVTTVLYNAGHEDAAEQVAAELGGADVREQPGNLSTEVDLHVVVGADRG